MVQLFTAVSYHTRFNSFLDSLISEVTNTDILWYLQLWHEAHISLNLKNIKFFLQGYQTVHPVSSGCHMTLHLSNVTKPETTMDCKEVNVTNNETVLQCFPWYWSIKKNLKSAVLEDNAPLGNNKLSGAKWPQLQSVLSQLLALKCLSVSSPSSTRLILHCVTTPKTQQKSLKLLVIIQSCTQFF